MVLYEHEGVEIMSNGALNLSIDYPWFQAFLRFGYGIFERFWLRFGTGIGYWKCLETYLMKKLKFEGALMDFGFFEKNGKMELF
jgi:hypothetical protein